MIENITIFLNFSSLIALFLLFTFTSCDNLKINQDIPINDHHFQVFQHWNINQSVNVSNNVETKLLISHNFDKNVYKLDIHVSYDKKCIQDDEMIQSISKSPELYSYAMKYGPDEIIVFIEGS